MKKNENKWVSSSSAITIFNRYLAVGLLHLPCYGVFALIIRLKNYWLSRSFPDAIQIWDERGNMAFGLLRTTDESSMLNSTRVIFHLTFLVWLHSCGFRNLVHIKVGQLYSIEILNFVSVIFMGYCWCVEDVTTLRVEETRSAWFLPKGVCLTIFIYCCIHNPVMYFYTCHSKKQS